MITVGELRKGITIELDDDLFGVVDYEHIKMGRGGAVVRLKLRNIRSGYTFERTFPASEKFRRAYLERRKVQFLYHEDDLYHFMDTTTFEQMTLGKSQLENEVGYLKDGLVVDLLMYNDEAIGVELPVTVELAVTDTEPGFRGDTATGATKPAVLETGMKVNVPLFVNVGDVLRIDTRTGEYVERAG